MDNTKRNLLLTDISGRLKYELSVVEKETGIEWKIGSWIIGGEITLVDDLCDGGGTFMGLATHLRKLNPTKLRLVVTHAVQKQGILNVASAYDEVVITNTYKDWASCELPSNVKVYSVI